MPTFEPCVIVGAGLAGSAAALQLARAGGAPLLLERSRTGQPRLCGEFISAEAAVALGALGVDVLALGGQPTGRLRLSHGGTRIEAALPFTAVGLSRCVLDAALQQQAQRAGARLQRGQRVAVRRVAHGDQSFELALSDGSTLRTEQLLLATGKTDLAPLARKPERAPEPLVGLQAHLRLAPDQARAIEGHVEVALLPPGYAGLQPIEAGLVNLCLLMPREPASAVLRGGTCALLAALCAQDRLLAERLRGAEVLSPMPQTIYRVPYGHLHRPDADDSPGLWRLGDQAAVIPSFTGDGMAIALHSAALASRTLLAGGDAAMYHRRLRQDLEAQMRRAGALYRLGHSAPGRRALLALLSRWPAALGWLAAMTRVPEAAACAP